MTDFTPVTTPAKPPGKTAGLFCVTNPAPINPNPNPNKTNIMITPVKHRHVSGRRDKSRRLKTLLLLLGCLMAVGACQDAPPPKPPPVPVTDTRPVGKGLEVIGYALLGAAVVVVLGRLLN